MEAIDRVVQLTTIDTLRSFDCRVTFGPTTDDVNIIRRTLLSYYEDHRWLDGRKHARHPIRYVFGNRGEDHNSYLKAKYFQRYMNRELMNDLLERPSRQTQYQSFWIIMKLYWKEREIGLPRTTQANMLAYYDLGVSRPLFNNEHHPWTDRGENRLM